MILALFFASLSSLLFALVATPFVGRALERHGVVGKDVHKSSRPVCAEMGGLAVLAGFAVGFFVALPFSSVFEPVLAFLTIFLVGCVGVVDDLVGLRQRYKPFLVTLASVPLFFISVGRTGFWFPLVGYIVLGTYFLLFVPLAVTTASNMTNMLAGYNGLEGGIGAISCFALGVSCILSGNVDACFIAFPLSAAFLGFMRYNWFPAKIFPGDVGTLVSGAAIATISIFGGVEFAGICVLAPSAIDFTLKIISRSPFSQRGRFGDTKVASDGVLVPASYPALQHAFLRVARLREKELVSWLLLMQIIYSIIGVSITVMLKQVLT